MSCHPLPSVNPALLFPALLRVLLPLQGGVLLAGSEDLEGWESCLFHCRHLQRAVEDLGAAVYAPQVSAVGGGGHWWRLSAPH